MPSCGSWVFDKITELENPGFMFKSNICLTNVSQLEINYCNFIVLSTL